MPTQRFSHLLHQLQLSDDDKANLRRLAENLVVHNVDQFNTLELAKNGSPADRNRWKEVRKKEDTRVYRERATKGEPLEIPSLLLLGNAVGTLEDVMYAVVAPTTESMRIRSAIVRDGSVDCKVLTVVADPTMTDPFGHLSVKWSMFTDPMTRDHVFIDATGIAIATDGERIGYHLMHSVGFEQLPNFGSYDVARTNMSVCSMYVERTPGTVNIYARGFYDLNKARNKFLMSDRSLNVVATQWLAFTRKMECAHVKKLLWTMHKSINRESIMSLTPDEAKPWAPIPMGTPGQCKICTKSFGFLGTSRKCCKCCCDQVCSRCSVIKTIVKLAPNRVTVVEKKRVFCVQCITDVLRMDATRIAREEILNAGNRAAAYY